MQNRSMRVTLCFFLCVVITLFLNGCSQGRAFSTTYHAHFFGLYKPKARKPATPQGAFATGFRGIHDPFSKHSRKHNYKLDGDGFHSVVRSKRHYNTMGRPANGRKKNTSSSGRRNTVEATLLKTKRFLVNTSEKQRKITENTDSLVEFLS
jgi:hypothetical protein